MPILSAPNTYYSHFVTRKVLGSFLDFLSTRLHVRRYDENGVSTKYIRPPIHFGHREKLQAVLTSATQPGPNNNIALIDINQILPRASLNVFSFNFDGERNINKHHKIQAITADEDTGTLERIMTPVPYSLDLELSILCKYLDDQYQIIEQLLPFFQPSLALDVNVLGPKFDPDSILFSLLSVAPGGAETDFGIMDDRLFETTMTFTAKCNYYYIRHDSAMIRELMLRLNLYDPDEEDYKRFKDYEITANNLAPIYEIEDRADEPSTTTVTDYEEDDE